MALSNGYKKAMFRILKLASLAITGVLGIFCNCDGVMYGPAPAYGMPMADYKISGTVKSSATQLPVKGLNVFAADTLPSSYTRDTSITDSNGAYSLEFSSYPDENNPIKVTITDVDGASNGSFSPKDTIVSIPSTDLKDPNGTWDKGHAEKTVDIKVDPTN